MLAKAHDLMAIPPSIDPDVGLVPEGRASGAIAFEDVKFEYPGRDGLVLRGATFECPAGAVLGMTGRTGCGKSTAMRLLERFYDVTSGRITLDGRDVREYSPRWLRSQIATVTQEPKLLPLSIRENIVFGCPHEPTLKEIEAACRAANIWDELNDRAKFAEGLRTQISSVLNVSGGRAPARFELPIS